MKRAITKRLVIHVGFSCNERCKFCYYRESLEKGEVKDLTTYQIKKRLRIGRKYGKNEVDFTGGEPTIRKDIFELISYAKKIGYKTICTITNGLLVSKKKFCQKLKEQGLNDILISIHSPEKNTHDYLTSVQGSWKKVIQAAKNAKELGINLRINTVITNLNYNKLGSFFNLMRKIKPNIINLLVFNPAEEAIKYREDDISVVDYNEVGNELKKALKKYNSRFEKINIRFLSFCHLKGFEKEIKTLWQIIYEKEEWDPILFIRYRKGLIYVLLFTILGFLVSLFNRRYYKIPFSGKKDIYTFWGELVRAAHIFHNYKHVKKCKSCSLKAICPGLNRAYLKKFKKKDVFPYEGKTIKNPLYFCKEI